MRSQCFKSLFIVWIVLTTSFIVVQVLLQIWLEWQEELEISVHHYVNYTITSLESVQDVVLVWWTPFTGNRGSYLECGSKRCFVTQDRRFQYHPQFQIFLFYGSNVDVLDLPLSKYTKHHWALLHEESPKNVPILCHEAALSLFNYTSTFSRYSDVPLTLQYLHSIKALTDLRFYVPLADKNILLKHLAPVLYIQSDCDTPLDRDAYVKELMHYIDIDSYGACLQTKKFPSSISNAMEPIESENFLKFVGQYKFTIAFENAVCEDYITEKLWRPLSVGSLPIYMGSPSVKDWLPNSNSVILALDFKSPKDLATFILYLNENDDEYIKFFSHKNGSITNEQLLSAMASRLWSPSEEAEYHFVNHFECEMCQRAHFLSHNRWAMKVASKIDYNCSVPISSLTREVNNGNPWVNQWHYGRCEAAVLKSSILNDESVNDYTEFHALVRKGFEQGLC